MRRTLIASVCLCLLALAGCGGGDKPASVSDPTTTATATPSASSAPTQSAGPQAPAGQAQTVTSAKVFATYALRLTIYAYEHRNLSALTALPTSSTCSGCQDGVRFVRREIRGKFRETSSGPPRVKSRSIVSHDPDATVVRIVFDMPGGKEIADSGKVRDTIDPAPGSSFEAELAWDGGQGQWQVENSNLKWGAK